MKNIFSFLCAAIFAWAVLACNPARAGSASHDISFTVTRNGAPIGTQSIAFSKKGDVLHVALTTRIAVKILFVTAYTFTFDGTETWKGGKLVALQAHTNDNGDKTDVTVAQKGGKLLMTSAGKTQTVPADIIPTTWWNKDLTGRHELLDVLTGKIEPVKISKTGAEDIDVGGKTVKASHYTVAGGITRDIWFLADGSIAKQSLTKKGDTIQYVIK